jgi:hypothetical protein
LSAGTVADGAYRIEPMGREDVARASAIIGRYRDFELGLVDADIKAGTDIPVVFSLGGDQGLGVIAIGFPQAGPISCTAPGELTSGVATAASGPSTTRRRRAAIPVSVVNVEELVRDVPPANRHADRRDGAPSERALQVAVRARAARSRSCQTRFRV